MPSGVEEDSSSEPRATGPVVSGALPVLAERYEIMGLIGAGGMGNVYKARDRELDEVVALKMLRAEAFSGGGALDAFRSEVKLARRVTHRNVARVFDIGEHRGEPFLTMEWIDGESLAAILGRERRLSIARVVEIAAEVSTGLVAAHAAGVVHRDLKPENIMIAPGGRVVVTDFGIAQGLDNAPGAEAIVWGTPAYMAPEQIAAGEADARSDLYAFGAVLYELLVGEPAFRSGSSLSVTTERLLQSAPDPRAKRPDVPDRLATLVRCCMARRPEDRPRSAEEVVAALASSSTIPPAAPPRAVAPDPIVQRHTRGVKRVAVLPFRNMGAPEQGYLADGITEDLIDQLSMSPGLRVHSRGMVMRYQGTERAARSVGRELDVHVVVEGSVRRLGGIVRITARLISVADGLQIWAKRFDRPEAELFTINDDTARAITEALAVEINAPQHPIASDPEATDLYLRARAAYHQFFSNTDGESIRLFERALTRAPGDARILAGYAMARARFAGAEAVVGTTAREAAERSIQIEPTLAEPHLALATVCINAGDPVGAVRPLRRALRLTPTSATAHDLIGRILCETTRIEDAQRHLEAALSIDPEIELARLALCRIHELAGDSARADHVMEIGAGRNVSFPALARMLLWRRDAERAKEVLRGFTEPPNASLRVSHALLELTAFGRSPVELLKPFQDPAKSSARRRAFFSQLEAEARCVLGEGERAFPALGQAVRDGLYDVAWMDHCPSLAPIRGDARFTALREVVAAYAARVEEQYLAPMG